LHARVALVLDRRTSSSNRKSESRSSETRNSFLREPLRAADDLAPLDRPARRVALQPASVWLSKRRVAQSFVARSDLLRALHVGDQVAHLVLLERLELALGHQRIGRVLLRLDVALLDHHQRGVV